MTKLLVMSDLHIEFGALSVPKVDADVAVLAGDIHIGSEASRWASRLSRTLGMPVVLIAGNHEFYGSRGRPGHDYGRIIAALRANAAAGPGHVAFLERETAVVGGVRFIGCTLWTDFEVYGDAKEAMRQAEKDMNDFLIIASRSGNRFTPQDARDEFLAALQFLVAELAKPFAGPTVVVTHHLPSLKSVAPEYEGDVLNAAYASNLDAFVEASGASLWLHGHTHSSCDYTIGATRVLCNPRGYHDFALNPRFDPALVVKIDPKGHKQ